MELFLSFGLIGFVELLILFGIVHYAMARKTPRRGLWLVPAFAFVCSFGYAFWIFVVEKEGQNSFSGLTGSDITLYLFVFSFFSIGFMGMFALLKHLLTTRSSSN